MKIIEPIPLRHPWPETLLNTIADVFVGGTPSTLVPSFWGGDIKWMSSGDVHLKQIYDVPGRITKEGLRRSNAKIVDPPAIAIALAGQGKTRGTAGMIRIPICTNQSVALVKNRNDELDLEYLFHNLEFRYEELRARSAGGGRAGLSKSIIEALPIPLPTINEQRKIGLILNVIDDTIKRTDRLIAKLKRAKHGLLHELLTRGIDEKGNIRSEETHEFKDSPLGLRIPEEWWLGSFGRFLNGIGGVIQTGPFGSQLHAEEYEPEGFPVVMPQDISEGKISTRGIARISAKKRAALKRHIVRLNDVVIARRGDFTRAAPITEREAGWVCGTGCLLLRTPAAKLLGNWFALMYSNHLIQRQIESVAVGSTMKNLNSSIIQSLAVSIPDIAEQRRIVTAVSVAERNIETMQTEHAKLQVLKRGLMNDLLTGKVRVNNLLKH